MGQDRLSDLVLLSVEKETLDKINFDDVIRCCKSQKNSAMTTVLR